MSLPGRGGPELTLARLAGASASTSLVLVAAGFALRRWCFGFSRPLALYPILLLSLALPALILLAVWPWTRGASPSRAAGRLIQAGLAVGGILLAAAVSLPGSPLLGVACLWGLLGATLAVLWISLGTTRDATDPRALQSAPEQPQPASPPLPRRQTAEPADEEWADEELSDDELAEEELAEHVLQQYERGLQPNGGEYVKLRARVPVQAGQRLAHFHLTICPPFTETVQAQADVVGDVEAQVEIGQVLPQGLRLDLRLDPAPEEDTEVIVECFVTGPGAMGG